jgi:hypothetical protein
VVQSRDFLAANAIWSALVLVLLFLDPGFVQPLSCLRLVGRSPECVAAQQALDDASWWLHTFPFVMAIAVGHAAIVLIALFGVRGRRTLRRSPER